MRDNNEDGAPAGGPVRAPATPGVSSTERRPHLDTAQDGDEEGSVLRPVSADMQQFIGRQLRAVFDDVARQPVPDRFLELMRQLDSKTGTR